MICVDFLWRGDEFVAGFLGTSRNLNQILAFVSIMHCFAAIFMKTYLGLVWL
jgi:hypothetical protein